MRKLFGIGFLLFSFGGLAAAQIPTSGNVFVGYSYLNTDLASIGASRLSANGWEGSFEGKIFPFIGMVADFSDHYGSGLPIACPVVPVGGGGIGGGCPLNASFNERNILFGPRVSMSVGKFRPFAEALFGAGHINLDSGGTDTSFATAVGGGLDVKIIRPVAWRFQGDYVQTRFFGSTQNNVRISTGIVFRF
jgi:hypothetical protein